jgi:hypothetical protein
MFKFIMNPDIAGHFLWHNYCGLVLKAFVMPESANSRRFDLTVDDIPYHVEARPFQFNDEERFNVRVNGGVDHVFAYDSELRMFRSLDDDATILPDGLEEGISRKLITGRS